MANLLSEFLNTISLTDNKIYRDAYSKAYSETYRTYPFISISITDSKKETEQAELMAVRAGMATGQTAVLEKLGQLVEEAKSKVSTGIDHGKEKLKELIEYTRLSEFPKQTDSLNLAGRLRTLRRSKHPRYLRTPRYSRYLRDSRMPRRSRKPRRN